MESIYWVLSRDCNQRCAHCYNDSAPGEEGLRLNEVDQCIAHFPDPAEVGLSRIILSGGEVLVWPELLFHALAGLRGRYGGATQRWVQTNGDLLNEATLDRLLDAGVSRIDVSSMDAFHHRETVARRATLEALFTSRGMRPAEDVLDHTAEQAPVPSYSFWGANPDTWIGPLWPRGRAAKKVSRAEPQDRFCGGWSGARNFLDYRRPGSEVNVQLSDVYPCCPMTVAPIGTLLKEPLLAILDRLAKHPVFQQLNAGAPERMGASLGVLAETGQARTEALGNHCLWCDEFFLECAPDLLEWEGKTVRGDKDLRAWARRRGRPRQDIIGTE